MILERKKRRLLVAIVCILTFYLSQKKGRVPNRFGDKTPLQLYFDIMNVQSEQLFRDVTRMDKICFQLLVDVLMTRGGMEESNKLRAGFKVIVYVYMLVGNSYRDIRQRLNMSLSMIHKCIYDVACAVLAIKSFYMRLPMPDVTHSKISTNWRYSGFFDDCLGALDGTHIPAIVPDAVKKPFRNRHGEPTQNVLAVVDFDLKFTYALAGIIIVLVNFIKVGKGVPMTRKCCEMLIIKDLLFLMVILSWSTIRS